MASRSQPPVLLTGQGVEDCNEILDIVRKAIEAEFDESIFLSPHWTGDIQVEVRLRVANGFLKTVDHSKQIRTHKRYDT